MQFAAHEVPFAHTRLDGQLEVIGAPLQPSTVPLHFLIVNWLVDAHVDEQVTLLADGVHALLPLQPPAVQVALFAAQVLCGSLPDGTLAHVPGDDARLHA